MFRMIIFTLIRVIICIFPFALVKAENLQAMYDKVGSSIYQLYAIDKNKQRVIALGSAVAISSHYLATNCHVALAGNFLIAKINNTPYLARLCYFNQDQDLCLVDVVGVALNPVKIRATKSVKVGESVFAISYPTQNKKLVSTGIVEKILSDEGYPILQNTAVIVHGSSGGGLFDNAGNLIGITSSGVSGKPIGYAIPTELILEVINSKNQTGCMMPPDKVCEKS